MADKDFKVKNKLFVNGLSQASGVVLSTNNNLDSHTNLPTQYGGTGTTTSPNAGQILYSTAGSTYTPTDLSSLTISNSGGSTITAASAATKGLVIQRAASQTANLIEWQNTDNSVLSSVGPLGAVSINTQNANALGVSALGALEVKRTAFFDSGTAATVAIIVRGRASQTADLQQWQDSSGAVLLRVYSSGAISRPSGGILMLNESAGDTVVRVRGFASQTANLQEWQNSAGTVLLAVNSSGYLNFNSASLSRIQNAGNTTIEWQPTQGWRFFPYGASNVPISIKGAASQTANLTEWQNDAGTVLASIDPNGQLRTPQILNTASFNNSRLQMTNTGSLFDVGVASNVALRVRGAASQTANLQEWQDSSGTVLARTTASGGIASSVFVTAGTVNAGTNLGVFTAYPVNASTVGIVIKGFASQTANLQEWQDSTGTVLSSVTANGRIFAQLTSELYGTIQSKPYTSGAHAIYAQGLGSTPAVRIDTISATANGLVIKGAASQTANLQEWQNSAGTTLSYMSPAGVFSAGTLIAGSGDLQVAYGGYFGGGTAGSYIGAALSVIPWSTTVAGVIVRGRASQTADLQQWQNSAGTVLAEITANGGLELNGKDVELMNYMGAF